MKHLRIVGPLLAALVLFGASGYDAPVVVVYPIATTGGSVPEAGVTIAALLATKIASLGGVTVKAATPATDRATYLDSANALGAGYYVAGYLTPLGADSSLVTQVVSTASGSVVFSSTANVHTFADAAAQAEVLRAAILRHAGRNLERIEPPSPVANSTATPFATDGSVNVSSVLHKRNRRAASTASPAATVALASPTSSGGALLFRATGQLDDATRSYATGAIVAALRRVGIPTSALSVEPSDVSKDAPAICKATPGTTSLVAAAISVATDAGASTAAIDMTRYDCAGKTIALRHARERATRRDTVRRALDAATATVAKALAAS
ncbi:MAG: hypothetical protein NVS2B8_05050 [Vulcanimicrobiaceae bacterium]